jgi:hypothetical protein
MARLLMAASAVASSTSSRSKASRILVTRTRAASSSIREMGRAGAIKAASRSPPRLI